MASIGQFNTAGTSVRAEATNSLVNVNLDISLYTQRLVEPPAEYAAVGQHLAPSRLHEAQEGTRHTIARKLGILFKEHNMLPSTPELIKAYGLRASEISRSSTANPRGDVSHGAFAGMIGADATTLWAAATSGRPALQCHLLACLLARIWEPAEATSIWAEIVSRRKEELKQKLADEGELGEEVLHAVTQEVLRSDLRDWDASVRAWMRVADSVMAKQQTQARLIIDNLSLPVNVKPDTYGSVMSAWSAAMTQMEKLLCGVPLQVHAGDILLALVSWHLYPDMKCLSTENKDIHQHDPLVEGRGFLTLGLEPSPRVAKDFKSVYWALPLSHLRFYGRLPVTRTRSVRTSDQDRITVDEMLWAMIASFIADWDDGSVPTSSILEFVGDTAMRLHDLWITTRQTESTEADSSGVPNGGCDSWLMMISRVCLRYKDRLGEERVRKLKAMGQRFGKLPSTPFQNVFNVPTYLEVARNLEDKISLFRDVAASRLREAGSTSGYDFLVAYKQSYIYDSKNKGSTTFHIYEYATACPEHGPPGDTSNHNPQHRRWFSIELGSLNAIERDKVAEHHLEKLKEMGEVADSIDESSPLFYRTMEDNTAYQQSTSHNGNVVYIHESRQHKRGPTRRAMRNLVDEYVRMKPGRQHEPTAIFQVIYGRLDDVALLRRSAPGPVIHQESPKDQSSAKGSGKSIKVSGWELSAQKAIHYFQPDKVDLSRRSNVLYFGAMQNCAFLGMEFIESLYSSLKGATVDVRVVQFDFKDALWLKSAIQMNRAATPTVTQEDYTTPKLTIDLVDTATCFACIAMMETGSYNLIPDELRNVFAVGAADSLYIASALIRDPTSKPTPLIGRFIGNIGRAGMAFMVPPKEPEIKSYTQIDEWYQYDHKEFDGKMEDCFKGTSLHLSFSEASQAVNIEFSGERDVEAYFLETLISVHDRETWIAELDILGALTDPHDRLVRNFLKTQPCSCGPASTPAIKIISIDNFAEMIVPPRQAGIIRADGNWQARLAAASICLAKGYKVILKPQKTCWGCLSKVSLSNVTVASIIDANKVVIL
ncbi:hypothetical protein F5Y04DRAFT_229443 [Hypomontagnella monticulosa]|nr:hypothetical protein F5Y04DRAFT_229443 [Hypomontagnella monticulosa]